MAINEWLSLWAENCPYPITVADKNGAIVYMNHFSNQKFSKDGSNTLLGKSLYDCHKPESNAIINNILSTGEPNTYYVIKYGKKKLVHQTAIVKEGEIIGISEISIEISDNCKTIVRS